MLLEFIGEILEREREREDEIFSQERGERGRRPFPPVPFSLNIHKFNLLHLNYFDLNDLIN